MTETGTREVILRTLAGDANALVSHTPLDSQRRVIRLSAGPQAAPTPASDEAPLPGTLPAEKKKQSPVVIAIAAIIALGAIGLAGYLLYSNLKNGASPTTVQTL